MKFNEELIEKIEKFITIKNRGLYCNSNELTSVYNEVFETNLRPTSCGACLRQRTEQLEKALKRYRSEQEALKNTEPNDTPSEENKPLTEANAGENKPKKVGRAKKQ